MCPHYPHDQVYIIHSVNRGIAHPSLSDTAMIGNQCRSVKRFLGAFENWFTESVGHVSAVGARGVWGPRCAGGTASRVDVP